MILLLLQADTGTARRVAADISVLPGVRETVVTSGPYDVIARAETLPGHGADRCLLQAVRRVPGLSRLSVCRGVGADTPD